MSLEQIWREFGGEFEKNRVQEAPKIEPKEEKEEIDSDKFGIIDSEPNKEIFRVKALKYFDIDEDNLYGKERDYFNFIVENAENLEDIKEIEGKTGSRLASDRLFKIYSYARLLIDYKNTKEKLKEYANSHYIGKTKWGEITKNFSRSSRENAGRKDYTRKNATTGS